MSKSTALVNSFFTWLWLWVHRDNNKNYYMCVQFCNVCHPCKVLSIKSRIQGLIKTDWTTGSPSSKYEHQRKHRHCCEGRWALGFIFLLFKNISLDNFLCYLILFIGNSKCRQALKFTIKWNRYWQVFLTCDDVKNRPKTTFFVGNAGAQWLCLNTGSLTLHLSISHVSRESSKPSVECACGSHQ